MSLDEWILQAARVRALWPRSGDWEPETIAEYHKVLSWLPCESVRDAITACAEEGLRTAPAVGELRKRALALKPDLAPQKQAVCVCAKEVGAYRDCESAHPEGWIERREMEESATRILHSRKRVDPGAYPGQLGETLAYMLLSKFYDENQKAFRAIQDAGDEHGCKTIGPGRGCLVEML